jgi:isocitrate lyase
MKKAGLEGVYVGGWATSAKGSADEDPGPDLASYPLSRVPEEAAAVVRALLAADRNQAFARAQWSEAARRDTPAVDYQPFVLADADTGHGGEAHVRNLIRRFVEAGVPAYHIEDQRPGVKKCGHQSGKVLVAVDEQLRRLSAARFQLDVMGVAGIVVARTDAEAATLLDSRGDERDQPYLLGATRLDVPPYKSVYLATLRQLHGAGMAALSGYQLYRLSDAEYAEADAWLATTGLGARIGETAQRYADHQLPSADAAFEEMLGQVATRWQSDAGVCTLAEAAAQVLAFAAAQGDKGPLQAGPWRAWAEQASAHDIRHAVAGLGLEVSWDCEHARTPDGFYPIRGGLDMAVARALAMAPWADVLWMETKTPDLRQAKAFAEAVHAQYPGKLLAYNLSPSFNWDAAGLDEAQIRGFADELGKLGFVFNFVTYGGHQIDGLAAEEFATALREDGMLALARLQRKFRLLESAYRLPQTLAGGPRADAALQAISGRTATTQAMGTGSTQHQHALETELPPRHLEQWLGLWRVQHGIRENQQVQLRPATGGSDLLELSIRNLRGEKQVSVLFAPIRDRHGRSILSVRDQQTLDPQLRRKRLMALALLYLIARYHVTSVHFLAPSDDNLLQAEAMQALGLFSRVASEAGDVLVAGIAAAQVEALTSSDGAALAAWLARPHHQPPAAMAAVAQG